MQSPGDRYLFSRALFRALLRYLGFPSGSLGGGGGLLPTLVYLMAGIATEKAEVVVEAAFPLLAGEFTVLTKLVGEIRLSRVGGFSRGEGRGRGSGGGLGRVITLVVVRRFVGRLVGGIGSIVVVGLVVVVAATRLFADRGGRRFGDRFCSRSFTLPFPIAIVEGESGFPHEDKSLGFAGRLSRNGIL